MTDMAVDSGRDIYLAEDGDVAFVEGKEALAQRIEDHLLTWAGEWYLDTGIGVEWMEYVFVKPFDKAVSDAIVKEAITGVPGVAAITAYDVTFDQSERGYRIRRLSVTSDTGETVNA